MKVTKVTARNERIVIYASKNTKKEWMRTIIDTESRNSEEAIIKLITLYRLSTKYFGINDVDQLIEMLKEQLGEKIHFNLV